MIKLLLIEDDIEMLTAMEKMIPWEREGFSIVGKAATGTEGLELIQKLAPQLVITDISMPGMDGLEMIRAAKGKGLVFKSIILTCHENFEYARESINIDVVNYLVKITLTEDKLLTSARKAQQLIKSEVDPVREFLSVEKLFLDLQNEALNQTQVKQKLRAQNKQLPSASFQVIQIYFDNYEFEISSGEIDRPYHLKTVTLQTIKQLEEATVITLPLKSGNTCFTFLAWQEEVKPTRSLHHILSEFVTQLSADTGVTITLILSPPVHSLDYIPTTLETVQQHRYALYFKSGCAVVRANPTQLRCDHLEIAAMLHPLRTALASLQKEASSRALEEILLNLSTGNYRVEPTMELVEKLFGLLQQSAQRNNFSFPIKFIQPDRFEKAAQFLRHALCSFFQSAEQAGKVSNRENINFVVEHIRQHYTEELACPDMAKRANMSVSHFSRVFKKAIGKSFSDFVAEVRISKANELLDTTDLPIEQIASEVGFENTSYFYRFYKKATGRRPGERRR